MKRYLWVVERKDGDEWGIDVFRAFESEGAANVFMAELSNVFYPPEHRVVKYTPAE